MIHALDGPHRGFFSHELEPALTIDPGDTVAFTIMDITQIVNGVKGVHAVWR